MVDGNEAQASCNQCEAKISTKKGSTKGLCIIYKFLMRHLALPIPPEPDLFISETIKICLEPFHCFLSLILMKV